MDKKKCNKCGLIKDVNEFSEDKTHKDGYRSVCKECMKEYMKDYRLKNKDKIAKKKKEYMKDYMKANKEKLKEYRLKNKDKIAKKKKEYMKDYMKANKEKLKEYIKDYRLKNKEKIKISSQRRRARVRSLANTLTVEEWNQTLTHFNFSCANCGSRGRLHMDHFIALSDDNCPGTTKNNCIPLCVTCNLSKGPKNPKDFFSEEKLVEIVKYLLSRNKGGL